MTTPSGAGRPPLEPVHVLRPRRTDALAELFREFEREQRGDDEPVRLPRPPVGSEDRTQELPPVPAARHPSGTRRTALALAVAAAALTGFGGALLFTDRTTGGHAAPAPGPSATAPPAPPPPADRGFLREGDSGPEVTELQERLLRVPDVYRGGTTDGRYDAVLSAAVARFQLWYGVRGDETGVYGDDTRLALESRTGDPAT
ncbi:peptidoglycan-binding domain-containing protein [Streptomyces marokkonensis]|uniref:peptidoglycan-binding domain-containing protein n=1 Tax=Streptomyces marokkonensis TaxID=324855 RepID=UPI0011F3F907|nr:peptidoglycan-binding domain-containing protein [Streptomyces marokkonensis]